VDLSALIARTIEQLDAGGVVEEWLATLKPGRRIGPITTAQRLVPVGRAWRLGELLITRDGQLYSTGSVTRAVQPTDFAANKSPAEHERRELQRAAVRGSFATGSSVNFGYEPISLGETPKLRAVDRVLTLRLQHAEVPLETYLGDRVRFAITPGWD
jgi:hypothetical protein